MLDSVQYEACVVEIGGSEMRKRGILHDRFDLFLELLEETGLSTLSPPNADEDAQRDLLESRALVGHNGGRPRH